MTQSIKSTIPIKTKSGMMHVTEGEPFILPDIDDDRPWEVLVLDEGVKPSLNGVTAFLRSKGRIKDSNLQVNAIRSVDPAVNSRAHLVTIGSIDACSKKEKFSTTQRPRRSAEDAINDWDDLPRFVRVL